jgi:hypothetical protein
MDILDTSFIRGTKKSDILAIATNRAMAVSPFTVWEILCHLDEVRSGESAEQAFLRRKGHVEILQGLSILDDPFAQHAAAVGAEILANPTRFEDRSLAREIIQRIVASPSLPALGKEVFTYPDGSTTSFKDIASRTRDALEHEERTFVANVAKMWDQVKNYSGIDNPAQLTDDELWRWVSAMLTALRESYERDGVATEALLLKTVESMYPYYGYLFERLRTYSKRPAGNLAIDPNDTEDGYICMHLRLFQDDLLVTGDGKTVRAIHRALRLWDSKVPTLPAKCNAIAAEDYRKSCLQRPTFTSSQATKSLDERRREWAYYAWISRGRPNGDDWTDWFGAVLTIPSY